MSSSSTAIAAAISKSMSSFHYRPTDAAAPATDDVEIQEVPFEPEITLTEKSLFDRLSAERTAGFAEAESKMRHESEQSIALQAARISHAIVVFEQAQKNYFARVEAEVVQLALAIAGKILHREAQVDPMLLAAIVHFALAQLKEGSAATVRVRPEEANKWRAYISSQTGEMTVNITEDPDLERGDCLLETELGTVNFSLDAQLKEVERGFFDVLAQKPKA